MVQLLLVISNCKDPFSSMTFLRFDVFLRSKFVETPATGMLMFLTALLPVS